MTTTNPVRLTPELMPHELAASDEYLYLLLDVLQDIDPEAKDGDVTGLFCSVLAELRHRHGMPVL